MVRNRKEKLRRWLEKQQNYFKTKKDFADELKRDLFKNVLGFLEREGYDFSKEKCKNEVEKLEGSLDSLASIMRDCYQQVLNKMWSIENND